MITLEEHLKAAIQKLNKEIRKGKEPNKNNIDGWTLSGLEKRLIILEECLFKLQKNN